MLPYRKPKRKRIYKKDGVKGNTNPIVIYSAAIQDMSEFGIIEVYSEYLRIYRLYTVNNIRLCYYFHNRA